MAGSAAGGRPEQRRKVQRVKQFLHSKKRSSTPTNTSSAAAAAAAAAPSAAAVPSGNDSVGSAGASSFASGTKSEGTRTTVRTTTTVGIRSTTSRSSSGGSASSVRSSSSRSVRSTAQYVQQPGLKQQKQQQQRSIKVRAPSPQPSAVLQAQRDPSPAQQPQQRPQPSSFQPIQPPNLTQTQQQGWDTGSTREAAPASSSGRRGSDGATSPNPTAHDRPPSPMLSVGSIRGSHSDESSAPRDAAAAAQRPDSQPNDFHSDPNLLNSSDHDNVSIPGSCGGGGRRESAGGGGSVGGGSIGGGGSVGSLTELSRIHNVRRSSSRMRAQLNANNKRLGVQQQAVRAPSPARGARGGRGRSSGARSQSPRVPRSVSAFGTGTAAGATAGGVSSSNGSVSSLPPANATSSMGTAAQSSRRAPSPSLPRAPLPSPSARSPNDSTTVQIPKVKVARGGGKDCIGGGAGSGERQQRQQREPSGSFEVGSCSGGGGGDVDGRKSPWRLERSTSANGLERVETFAGLVVPTTESVRPQQPSSSPQSHRARQQMQFQRQEFQQQPQQPQQPMYVAEDGGSPARTAEVRPKQQQQPPPMQQDPPPQQYAQQPQPQPQQVQPRQVQPQVAQQIFPRTSPPPRQQQAASYASPPPKSSSASNRPPRGPAPATTTQSSSQGSLQNSHSQRSLGMGGAASAAASGERGEADGAAGVTKTPPPPSASHQTPSSSSMAFAPGGPSPSRTYSPVDLDETPPQTPLSASDTPESLGLLSTHQMERMMTFTSPDFSPAGSSASPLADGGGSPEKKDEVGGGGARGVHHRSPSDREQQQQEQQQQQASSVGGGGGATPPNSSSARPPSHPSPAASVNSANNHDGSSPACPGLLPLGRTPSSQRVVHRGATLSQASLPGSVRSARSTQSIKSSTQSIQSDASKSLADLAVDSNCIAGRFQEVVVTLSESETFDSADEEYLNEEERAELARGREQQQAQAQAEREREREQRREWGGPEPLEREGLGIAGRPRTAEEIEEDRARAGMPEGMDYGPPARRRTTPPVHPNGSGGRAQQARQGQQLHASPMRQPAFGQNSSEREKGSPSSHRRSVSLEDLDITFEENEEEEERRGGRLEKHLANGRNNDRGDASSPKRSSIPVNIQLRQDDQLSPSSLMTGITNMTGGGTENVHVPANLRDRVEIDHSDLPPVHDRAKMFVGGRGAGDNGVDGGHPPPPHPHQGRDHHEQEQEQEQHQPPEPAVQYRSSWMLPNPKAGSASVGPGSFPGPQTAVPAGGKSAPGGGYRNGARGGGGGGVADPGVMANVMDRVRTSVRAPTAANNATPPPSRARSVSPGRPRGSLVRDADCAMSLTGTKLRPRRDLPDAASGNGAVVPGAAGAPSIVFGDPTSFGAAAGENVAQDAPTIRDRAKAIEGWMGGKGIAVNKEVKPTAGYDHDDMYQNAYIRKTSPQIVGRKKAAAAPGADEAESAANDGRAENASDASSVHGYKTAKKSPPPTFLASAVAAWSRGENSPPRPREEPAPSSAPREFAAPRGGGQNHNVGGGSDKSNKNNKDDPGQEARPYRQFSPTKENAPPAFLSAVDGWKKEDAPSKSSHDRHMSPNKYAQQQQQQQQNVDPAADAKQHDDMAYLASWSRSRGTPHKSPKARGSASNKSLPSVASSPDPFAAVENGSFSDEFGTDGMDGLGDDYHSPDRAEWEATAARGGGGGPLSSSSASESRRAAAKQTILFDDRAADHDDGGWGAPTDRGVAMKAQQQQKQQQKGQKSLPITSGDSKGDEWQTTNKDARDPPTFDDDDIMWGSPEDMGFGAGSPPAADAGGFDEAFDDPFFKSDFGNSPNAFRESEYSSSFASPYDSSLASPSSYPRQQTAEL